MMRYLAFLFLLVPAMASAANGMIHAELPPATSARLFKAMPNGFTSSDGALEIACRGSDSCYVQVKDSKLTAPGNSAMVLNGDYSLYLYANEDGKALYEALGTMAVKSFYGESKYFSDEEANVRLGCYRKPMGKDDDFSCTLDIHLG